MNKLLTKIVGAALGVAMTVGVGVAVASNANKDMKPAYASEATGFISNTSGGTSGTGSKLTATSDGITFTFSKGYKTGSQIRSYASGSITISYGNTITVSAINMTVGDGKLGGTWTGATKDGSGNINWNSISSGASVSHTDQARVTALSVTYTTSSSKPRGTLAITSPSTTNLTVDDTGDLTYSWTPNAQASTATISSATWSSSDSTVIEVNNSTNKYLAKKAGTAVLTLTATDSTEEEYSVLTSTITVANKPYVLPDMPNGDYVKVTEALEDYTGFYLIVFESNSVAFNGDLATLDATSNSVDVTITDGIIENSSSLKSDTLNKSAVYISKNGDYYDVAANLNKESVVFIGNDSGSNKLNQSSTQDYHNSISFSTKMTISGAGSKTMGYNNDSGQKRFRYLGSDNVSYYKKTAAVDTLRSIEIVNPTTSLKDGQKFVFGGSVTATYSITGTTGHTGITSGLSFFIGGEPVDTNTTMTRGEYVVTVSYNDGTTTKTNTYTLTVGYADATSVTIDGPSSMSVAKGWTGTFTATVAPSNAENVVVWSVTDESGDPSALATIGSSTGAFTAGNTAGTVRAVATSKDGCASSYVTVTISGDPLIELDKTSITAYSIDNPVSLTATPKNFPEGTTTYSWSSNDTSVATVANVATATNNVSFVSGGTTTITVTGYVGGVQKAQATCAVTVTKTRSVTESALLEATYNFSSITNTGDRLTDESVSNLNDYFNADEAYPLDEPTLSLPSYDSSSTNYVYLGNGTGGAYPSQGGLIKLGKSNKLGSISFTFTHTITKVVVSAQKWLSSGTEGIISINGTAPESNAGSSAFADVVVEGLSATTITISSSDASARVFVKSIKFYSQQNSAEIGRTADVVGLEDFIETKLHWSTYHNDHVDGDNTGTGDCVGYYDKDGNTGAKYAFNHLNAHQRKLFTTHSAYAAEWKRLQDWAKANGESLDESNLLATASNSATMFANNNATNAAAIISIIAVLSLSAVAGYFMLRKRKEQ